MRGYALFPKEKTPPKYPALQGEFFRVALLDLAHGTKCLSLQDFQTTFHLALSLSEVWKDKVVVAHKKTPLQEGSTIKAYIASSCVMKLGQDDDEELMFRMGQTEEEQVRGVLLRFFGDENIKISSTEGLVAYLGLVHTDMGFGEASNVVGSRVLLFIDRTSRLYLEM
jgi:hypothetical protein